MSHRGGMNKKKIESLTFVDKEVAMRFYPLCTILAICVLFGGCPFSSDGVRFSDVTLTNDIPQSFKDRNVYPDQSGILKYKLEQIAGSIIYHEPNAEYYDLKKIVLPKNYHPVLEIVKDDLGKVFEGTVNRNAAVKGSYLSFAASLDAKSIATFSIRDRVMVFVNSDDVPWEALVREARVQKPNPATKRYWIQGALMSSLDAVMLTEISANASAVVGPTLGAEAKVYNKSGQEIHDYKISVHLIDLDKLAQEPPATISMMLTAPHSINAKNLQPAGISLLKFREADIK
jgi:hypothetical protein